LQSTNDGQTTAQAINALLAGNKQELYRMGISEQQAASMLYAQGGKNNAPLSKVIPTLLTAGMNLGMVFKEVTDNVAGATRAVLASPDAANPEQVGIISAFTDTLKIASLQRPGAEGVMLGSLAKDVQRVMANVLVDSAVGTSVIDSIRNTGLRQAEWSKLTEEERTSRTTKMQKAVTDMLTPSFFTNAYAAVNPNASRLQLDSPEFQQYSQALLQQTVALSRQPDYAWESPAVLAKMAEGMVANRTVSVQPEGGAESKLVLPEAAVSVFGLSDKDQRTRFSEALTELYGKKEAGAEARFRLIGGVLSVQRIVDGVPGPAKPVDPERIKTRMQEKVEDAKASGLRPVVGRDYDIGAGASIRINGDSSSTLSRGTVMDFREQLLRDEGVRFTAYPDKTADGTLVGIAVGAGHNVTGQLKPGDKVTPAQAELWFKQDTDAVLVVAEKAARDWGVTDHDKIAAMGLAIYQLGEGGWSKFKDAKAAYQAGDWATFEAEIRGSTWAKQTPARVETFLSKFKGWEDPTLTQYWMQR